MFPGMGNIDPKMMKQAMKAMGVKQEEINASEVIIKANGKKIVFRNPQVMKIEMRGEASYQISGESEEIEDVNEDDVKLVMEQASVDRETAMNALKNSNGDIAEAIVIAKEE
jgi:nascent polypeptide-associated complex subunit alpha